MDADRAGKNPPIAPNTAAKATPIIMICGVTVNWNAVSANVEKFPTPVVTPFT